MSRNSRLTADITLEAHNMLRGLVDKHERSKGYLIEKMIRKFCEEVMPSQTKEVAVASKPKAPVKKFTPPTVEEVFNYCNERCNNVDAQSFVDHYSSNGWMRGKNKIKDWKACVRTWEKNNQQSTKQTGGKTAGNLSACEDFING